MGRLREVSSFYGKMIVMHMLSITAGRSHSVRDGKLYITVGDHFFAPDAQNLTNYHGKILRINSDGTIPPDNPFFDGAGTYS